METHSSTVCMRDCGVAELVRLCTTSAISSCGFSMMVENRNIDVLTTSGSNKRDDITARITIHVKICTLHTSDANKARTKVCSHTA